MPNVLLMENVPQVIGQQNVDDFNKWQLRLEQFGYKNYHQLLNAKDYGIPQNRNRCFMVSILGEYNYNFPKKQKLKLRLKDLLEKDVNEKYYLTEKQIIDISNWNAYEKPLETMEKVDKTGISPTLTTRTGAYAAGMVLIKEKSDDNMRIRKLTPKECWRLMGVKDEDYEKVKTHQSESSLYHLAGDSIVVNVLMEIFKMLLKEEK